jgi:hypothetical protein
VPDLTMSAEELDRFLAEERVVRIATLDDEGWPAVVPLWFVWHDGALWVWNLNRARRTGRLEAGAPAAIVVDAGEQYVELRGASGRAVAQRIADDDVPVEVRVAYSRKHFGTDHPLEPADHHTWFRLVPSGLATWDFRKLVAG